MDVMRWDGKKITRPGVYMDLPIDSYHSDICDGPSISSSGLRELFLKSPMHYFDKSYLNPDRAGQDDDEKAEAQHFRMGRAGHTLMLEPEKFHKQFIERDHQFADWRTKASQEWRKEKEAEGFTVLSPAEMLRISGIARSLREHRWHQHGILDGIVEASLIWKDPITGIWLKSRPDAIPFDDQITDLKCARSAQPEKVKRSINELGYDMQLALTGVGMATLMGRHIETFWLVVVESDRPHAVHVETLSLPAIYWGRIRLRKAIEIFKKCWDEKYWPAYDRDGSAYEPPQWQIDSFQRYQNSGLLPKEEQFP